MKLRNLKGKSASDLKIEEDNFESLESVSPDKDQIDKNVDLQMNSPEFQETTIQEYSILEKCIKQYEAFFQIYFSRQILHIISNSTKPSCLITINLNNGSSQSGSIASNEDIIEDNCPNRIDQIDKMFDTLKLNDLSRTTMLHSLLHKSMTKPTASSDTSDYDYKECMSDSDKYGSAESVHSRKVIDEVTEASVKQLMNLKLGQSLRCAVKLASSLLMEMSTFPSYNQNLVLDDSGELYIVGDSVSKLDIYYSQFSVLLPPVWLKVLVLIACYCKSDRELQLATISTLFELISLLKSQLEHSSNPGVTYVVMIPLLKFGHINYLEIKTRTIQVS